MKIGRTMPQQHPMYCSLSLRRCEIKSNSFHFDILHWLSEKINILEALTIQQVALRGPRAKDDTGSPWPRGGFVDRRAAALS